MKQASKFEFKEKVLKKTLIVVMSICTLSVLPVDAAVPLQQNVSELIRQALNNNPQIRAQQANSRSADADVETARWQFYPTPSLSTERAVSQNQDPTYANGSQVRYLRLQQPVYTWGRLTAGLSKAQARQIANVAAVEESKQQIALRVVQAYTEWVTATLRHEAFLDGYREHQKFESLITRRINTGVSPSADLLLVQSRLAQIQGDLLQAASQQEGAKIKLSQLLGKPINDKDLQVEALADIRSLLARPAQSWLDRAESVSPSLARLNAQATAARLELEERKSSLLPELYVRMEYQSGSPYTTKSQADQTRLFVGFTSNIGPGLSGLSALDSGKAKYEAALEDVDAGRRTLQEQISSDFSSLEQSFNRYAVLTTAQQFSQDLVAGGERQFLAGKKSWQELMNTSRELVQAKTQIAEMRASLSLLTWRISLFSDQLDAVLQPQYFKEIKP